jgi:O-antigen/teichoic acid export membrane protein
MIRAALRYGLPLLASGITTWISLNGIRIVVERFGGAVELGLLSVPWGVGQRVASVAAMLVAAAAFPLAVRLVVSGEKDKALSQLALNGAMLIAILLPTAAGLIVLNEPAVRLMIAAPFQETTMLLLPLVALSGAIRNIRVHYADQVFLLFERSDRAFLVSAGEALFCMAGCVIGYRIGGLWGCVVGCIAGHGLAMLLGFGLAVLGHGLRIPVGDVAKPLLASLVMAAILNAFIWPGGAMGLGLAVLVGAVVYAVMMAMLHIPLLMRVIDQKGWR